MDRTEQLGRESVGHLLFKFSLPAIVGMLVNGLYSIVDRIFVGRGVGSLALSGVAITFPITNIIMAFGMLVGIGAGAAASIRLGEKRKNDAELILGNAYTLVIVLSLILTALGLIFLEPVLVVFGASAETMPYAKQFATIIICGIVLQNIGFGLNNLIRSEGNPKVAMITMLIGAIINFILNPIFIFILKMGVAGSALATIFSQTVCSIWILLYFTGGKSTLKLKKKNMKLNPSIVKFIFSIGMSPFALQMAASVVTILYNVSLKTYGGDLAIGAMALINSVAMLILMPIFGINQGSQPIIGYNYGSKNIERVKKALKYAIISATCISTLGFIAVEAFPVQIVRLFNTDDASLTLLGSHGIKIFLCMLPIVGFQIVSSNYFQSVGKANKAMLLSLSRQVIILIPLLLILPPMLKIDGVWIAGPTADFIASLITAGVLYHEIKSLNKFTDVNNVKEVEFV